MSKVIGKSMDDSIRLLHIVLHDILMSDTGKQLCCHIPILIYMPSIQAEGTQIPFRLTSVKMRDLWEDRFTKAYLLPVIKVQLLCTSS